MARAESEIMEIVAVVMLGSVALWFVNQFDRKE
jgi:hypothetical protein